MKQVALCAAFIAASLLCFPQTALVNKGVPDFTKKETASEIVNEIVKVMELEADFKIKSSDKALNIEATISHRQRYIIYNPSFMNWVSNATNDKWAAIALFAHEIGHHINGHTSKKHKNSPALELQADEFAGHVLRRMGATLEQAQLVMVYISTANATKTHPGRADRLLAIQKGWEMAANADGSEHFAKNNQ
jgi:glutamate synthase domain-containing protein 2